MLTSTSSYAQDAKLEDSVVIVTTGGAFEKALKEHFYDSFTAKTGVRVVRVSATPGEQIAKIKAMSQTGRIEWDIVSVPADIEGAVAPFLQDIDCAAFKELAAQAVPDACGQKTLLRSIGGALLAYNPSAMPVGKKPESWVDFWDVKNFPGPRALPNFGQPHQVLMAALLADGVEPAKLFPLDLDRAFRKLDEIKPHVRVWWKTGDQSTQAFRSGEVVMGMIWSGRAFALKSEGVPIATTWNGAPKDLAYWSILQKAPHPKAANAFLEFFISNPKAHAAFTKELQYDTINKNAVDLLDPEASKDRATIPSNWQSMPDTDYKWVEANLPQILERWNAWIAK
jgi:mannopine transport system substrate-binding protein